MGVVNEPIEDRVGECRVSACAETLCAIPAHLRFCRRQKTCGRSLYGSAMRTVPVIEHLEQITPRRIGHRSHREIVEHQNVGSCPLREQPGITPTAVRDRHLFVELRHMQIAARVALPAGLVHQGASQPALAKPGRCN